jgi:hypothetical protein
MLRMPAGKGLEDDFSEKQHWDFSSLEHTDGA